MFIFDYVLWHYTKAIWAFLKIWGNFLKFFWLYLFPVPRLAKTLFNPWKRDLSASSQRGFDPGLMIQNLSTSLASRLVGFLVRFSLIIAALVIEIAAIISGLGTLAVWAFWPLLIISSAVNQDLFSLVILAIFSPLFIGAYVIAKTKPADELTIQEILNKKWAKSIWERLGINPSSVPKNINQDEKQLDQFLEQAGIKKEDFNLAMIWEISTQKEMYLQKRFWRKEKLFSISGVGRDLVYGYTVLLDRYEERIHALANYEELISHRNELELIERGLSKSRQSNILLIGEPGVGKMSLVQKFSRLITTGKSASNLNYKRVILLSIKQAMAGLKTPGEIEERLINIFTQAKQAGNVILVIDNFHHLVGSSSGDDLGKKDISQILLPFLEGGYFQMIAITTYQGLHNQVEQNEQLMKFFDKVEVREPDKETTEKICQDSVREIEARVPVKITVQAIKEIVEKAEEYISDAPFPEKAIDLLEEVAIYTATRTKDYMVTPRHVDLVISQKTEVPIGDLEATEKEKLLHLEDILHQRIINQELAINDLSSAMRRTRLQISERRRPIGSFLFLGPTGVGKTETAKALAEIYFGSEERMNRFDMSEFQGSNAIEKMIGNAQNKTPGLLTTAVKENPFSLLLLDEIEKADYAVLNLFLQVLEEGWLTDSLGRKINFKNQIIIATSNAGAEFIRQKMQEKLDDEILRTQLMDHVLKNNIFKPEFINRFDGVITFKPLTKEHLLLVAKLMLNGLKKRLAKQDLLFDFDEKLIAKVAELGYDPANGARPMRRVLQRKVEDLIAQKMLKNEIQKKSPFIISAEEI